MARDGFDRSLAAAERARDLEGWAAVAALRDHMRAKVGQRLCQWASGAALYLLVAGQDRPAFPKERARAHRYAQRRAGVPDIDDVLGSVEIATRALNPPQARLLGEGRSEGRVGVKGSAGIGGKERITDEAFAIGQGRDGDRADGVRFRAWDLDRAAESRMCTVQFHGKRKGLELVT